MSPRQIRNIKPANLSITNKTLKIDYPHVVYQIRNIATFNKTWYQQKEKPNLQEQLETFIIAFLILIAYFLIMGAFNSLSHGQVINAIVCSVLFGLLAFVIYKKNIKRTKTKKQPLYIHGVSISTNDGKKVSIYDSRQEYIEQIMASLHEVMENQDTPASYHFQVEGDLIQQSGNFDVGVNQGNIN
jgi:hypothetical protein